MTASSHPIEEESAREHIRNAMALIQAEQELHGDERELAGAVFARLEKALWAMDRNPPQSRYSPAARVFISDEIEHLVRDKRYRLDRAIAAAMSMARRRGFKVPPAPNPLLALVNPDGTIGVGPVEARDRGRLMAKGVHSISYRHRDDGYDYEHDFEEWDQVQLRLLDDYRVLIFSETVPIVQMFDMED